jgi:hypothetical protein
MSESSESRIASTSVRLTTRGLRRVRSDPNRPRFFLAPAGHGQEPKEEASKPQAKPTRLSGNGDRTTKKFQLAQGLVLWKIEHDGRSNFQVELLDDEGNEVNMPINHIGRYNGSQAGHVRQAGKYRLQVKADGAWSVTVDLNIAADADWTVSVD